MTKFKFSFEERKCEGKEELTNSLAGTYNFLLDEVKVYLPNIANAVTIYVPGFMTLFNKSFIHEVEDDCIKQIQKTLKHEYEHKSLCTTECPLGEQHKAMDAIEAMEMTKWE